MAEERWSLTRCGQPVSRDLIFFFFYAGRCLRILVFDWMTRSSQVITLVKKVGVGKKAEFWRESTPGALFDFLPRSSQSTFGKSLI